MSQAKGRQARVERKTKETDVTIHLDVDGTGASKVATPIPFFSHMLEAWSKHGLMDLTVEATGDVEVDIHHTVEDVGIVLGDAVLKALGDKQGIVRFGHAYVPLDEALSRCVIDLSGRPWLHFDVAFKARKVGKMPTELFEDFFWALADHGRMNIHLDSIRGRNAHHVVEAVFKAAARALGEATTRDPRVHGVPSTKGSLSG